MRPKPIPRIREEDLAYALKLLEGKLDSVDKLRRYWKICGHSSFPGPRIERTRPQSWDHDLPIQSQ